MKMRAFFLGFGKGFRDFSHVITNTVNFFLLIIVYIFGIGLVSVISKISGKHFLDLKKKGTSWTERNLKTQPIEKYYRMF